MKPINYFKPDDFVVQTSSITKSNRFMTHEEAASSANAKLQKIVESAPVAYGNFTCTDEKEGDWRWDWKNTKATHQARLLFIEPLEVKECEEHVPLTDTIRGGVGKCMHCGKIVTENIKWEVVK